MKLKNNMELLTVINVRDNEIFCIFQADTPEREDTINRFLAECSDFNCNCQGLYFGMVSKVNFINLLEKLTSI
jgi:hypothetical protein